MISNVPKIKTLSGVPARRCANSDMSLAAGPKPALTLGLPSYTSTRSCAGATEAARVLVQQQLVLLPGAAGEKDYPLLGQGLAGESGLCWIFSS